MILLGISGTGALIRIMRGTLLDELSKQYVITARAKGLKESRLLFKYPVRLAINPLISTIGWLLPFLFSGELLISLVLDIPTIDRCCCARCCSRTCTWPAALSSSSVRWW